MAIRTYIDMPHFSPNGNCIDAILAAIGSARHSILLAAYVLASHRVADALCEAAARVPVQVLLDPRATLPAEAGKTTAVLKQILAAGCAVRLDWKHPIFHDKYLVVDTRRVEMGSYNYTAQAERNAENLVTIHCPRIAAAYANNFAAHWKHAKPTTAEHVHGDALKAAARTRAT